VKSSAASRAPLTIASAKLPEKVRRLLEAAIWDPATTSPKLREVLFLRAAGLSLEVDVREPPEQLRKYSDKVALWAYKVLDDEVEDLRMAGYSDDQIFEMTICSALGAGAARFESGLRALEEALKSED
jgi:hypothetical protein